MKKLIWSRLKNLKCPACNELLVKNHLTENRVCVSTFPKCEGFAITKEAFNRTIESLYKNPRAEISDEEMENQQGLSDL